MRRCKVVGVAVKDFNFLDHWYLTFPTAIGEIIKHDPDKVIAVYGVQDFVLDALTPAQRTRILLTGDPRQAKYAIFLNQPDRNPRKYITFKTEDNQRINVPVKQECYSIPYRNVKAVAVYTLN